MKNSRLQIYQMTLLFLFGVKVNCLSRVSLITEVVFCSNDLFLNKFLHICTTLTLTCIIEAVKCTYLYDLLLGSICFEEPDRRRYVCIKKTVFVNRVKTN